MTKTSNSNKSRSASTAAARRRSQAPPSKKAEPVPQPPPVQPSKAKSEGKVGKKEHVPKQEAKGESAVLVMASQDISRARIQIDRNVVVNGIGLVCLSVASFVSRYSPLLTNTTANNLVGTLYDDLARAMKGYVSLFSRAPRVWWQIRQKVKPASTAKFSLAFDGYDAGMTYGPTVSNFILGAQPTAPTATPAASSLYSNVAVANADYDVTQELFGAADRELDLCGDPYGDAANKDPSAYAFTVTKTSATYAIGQVTGSGALTIDHRKRLEERPRTRWAAALQLATSLDTDESSCFDNLLTSGCTTEIGHRLLSTSTRAPSAVKKALPVAVPISLLDLITRTIKGFNAALKAAGVADGAITAVTVDQFAAYMIGVCLEWFAPWSCVAPPMQKWANLLQMCYNACNGANVSGIWKGSPVPAALAINLSLLMPCYDSVRNRVYYPVLVLDCDPTTVQATGSGYVFATQQGGSPVWDSYYSDQFCAYFDTAGLVQTLLAQYAGNFPIRTFPKQSAGYSLACTQGILFNGSSPPCAMTSHKPKQEELEYYNLFVLPYITATNQMQFLEWTKMCKPFQYTPIQQYGNQLSYSSFAILNDNMLSSLAKQLLDEFDNSQEKSSGMGWIGTGALIGTGFALKHYAPTIATVGVNAAKLGLYLYSRYA